MASSTPRRTKRWPSTRPSGLERRGESAEMRGRCFRPKVVRTGNLLCCADVAVVRIVSEYTSPAQIRRNDICPGVSEISGYDHPDFIIKTISILLVQTRMLGSISYPLRAENLCFYRAQDAGTGSLLPESLEPSLCIVAPVSMGMVIDSSFRSEFINLMIYPPPHLPPRL